MRFILGNCEGWLLLAPGSCCCRIMTGRCFCGRPPFHLVGRRDFGLKLLVNSTGAPLRIVASRGLLCPSSGLLFNDQTLIAIELALIGHRFYLTSVCFYVCFNNCCFLQLSGRVSSVCRLGETIAWSRYPILVANKFLFMECPRVSEIAIKAMEFYQVGLRDFSPHLVL